MTRDSKIILSIFLFYLIFGMNNLLGDNRRFIAPHILDSFLTIGLSLYYFILKPHSKLKWVAFSTTLLYGIIGFVVDPQLLILFQNQLDLAALSTWLEANESVITTLLLAINMLFFGILSLWAVKKAMVSLSNYKYFLLTLGIGTFLLFTLSLFLRWDLIYTHLFIFCVGGLTLTQNSRQEQLALLEHRYLLVIFAIMMMSGFEHISLHGLLVR